MRQSDASPSQGPRRGRGRVAALSLIAITLLLSSCWLRGGGARTPSKPLTSADIKVGLTAKQFQLIYPEARLTPDGEWRRPGEVGGLIGEWLYSFNRRSLSWYIFNSYESDVNAATFKEYLDATRRTIAAFTQRYGVAESVQQGITEFKSPTSGYGGYPVLSASWVSGQESVRIAYSVIASSAGSAQLLFTVEYRRASAVSG